MEKIKYKILLWVLLLSSCTYTESKQRYCNKTTDSHKGMALSFKITGKYVPE